MKRFSTSTVLGTAAAALLVFSSCKDVYECGDPIPAKKPGGKRMEAVIGERDSLCTELSAAQSMNSSLTAERNDYKTRLARLESINSDQADQFGKELTEKERMIRDRERMIRNLQSVIARQDSITRALNNTLRDALLGFNSDELQVEIRDGKVYVSMSDKLLFKSGSAAVEAKGVEALQILAGVLNKNPDINVLVEGHTDNVPIKTAMYKDNWDLSVARATSITRLLTEKYSVAPTRITASGRGEYFPRDTNTTQEGKARNRRTEIILSPKLDEIMNLLNSGR